MVIGMSSLLSSPISDTRVSVLACFPPLIGYTTLITLCGFAYGMKGFWLAAPASIVGSALVFILLRYFFSDKLRAWSTSNAKWAALESVVVRSYGKLSNSLLLTLNFSEGQRPPSHYSHQNLSFPSLDLL